jgi:hypothetical protein
MRHFAPLGHIDIFALVGELWARRALFDAVTLRQDAPGSAHKDTRAIFLRGPEVPSASRWFEDLPHVDYPALAGWESAAAVLAEIAARAGGRPMGKAMIVALRPGGIVTPHIDQGAYAERHDRYHLPLVTNPDAVLVSGDETVHAPAGLLAWFDNHAMHSAENLGAADRIHLIVDVRIA